MWFLEKLWKKADQKFTTSSDIGGVRVGNAQFSVNIKNGYGDGKTKVGVYTTKRINNREVKYDTVINGTFNIYDYDCSKGDEGKVCTLTGRFGVYYLDGYVFFEKWS